jgi:hypothetical protein
MLWRISWISNPQAPGRKWLARLCYAARGHICKLRIYYKIYTNKLDD